MKRILVAAVCGLLFLGTSAFAADGAQKDGAAQKGGDAAQKGGKVSPAQKGGDAAQKGGDAAQKGGAHQKGSATQK